MKKLIFIRHAKAEETAGEISDFERSLTIKGKITSKLMARKLKTKEDSLGIIITSPAFRALETSIIFAREFGVLPDKIILNNKLYFKMNFQSLLEFLSLVNEDDNTVTLFGHNPSFTEIANNLTINGCDVMPKCSVVVISFKIRTWSEIRPDTGKIDYSLKPEKII